MITYNVAKDQTTITALAAAFNIAGVWGSRLVNWHPQPILPAVLSTAIYSAFEFIAIKAQRSLEDSKPNYLHYPRDYYTQLNRRIHLLSAFTAAAMATVITPIVSKRFGSSITLRASATFTLSSLLCSAVNPVGKMRGR